MPLIRLQPPHSLVCLQVAMDTLCALVQSMGPLFSVFVPVLGATLAHAGVSHRRYEALVAPLAPAPAPGEAHVTAQGAAAARSSSSDFASAHAASAAGAGGTAGAAGAGAAAAGGSGGGAARGTGGPSDRARGSSVLAAAAGEAEAHPESEDDELGDWGPTRAGTAVPSTPTSGAPPRLNPSSLKSAWEATQRSTRDDWHEWML